MRMWNVNPVKMCRQHLLGEHNELHMIVGSVNSGNNLEDYITYGIIDLSQVYNRHAHIVSEMLKRGYKHNSILPAMRINNLIRNNFKVNLNTINSESVLMKRCSDCRDRCKLFLLEV